MTDHESAQHREQRLTSQWLVGDLKSGRLSRREFMVRAAALGFSGAAINAFLIACGGDAPATSAPATTAAATATPTRAAVGINVRLDVLERRAFTQWREARKDQAFDMYLGGWFSDYEDPSNWHNFFFGNPDQEFWHTHFSQLPGSRAYLDLIRRANQERNRQQREQLYQQAERILLEELPLAPVFNQQDVVMVKPYVKGLVHTNLSQDLFGGVKILAR